MASLLLPPEYFEILQKSFRVGSLLAGHSFGWKNTENEPCLASARRILVSVFNSFLLGSYNLHLAVQTVRLLRSNHVHTVNLVFLVNIWLMYGYAFVISVVLSVKRREFLSFLKVVLDLMGKAGRGCARIITQTHFKHNIPPLGLL